MPRVCGRPSNTSINVGRQNLLYASKVTDIKDCFRMFSCVRKPVGMLLAKGVAGTMAMVEVARLILEVGTCMWPFDHAIWITTKNCTVYDHSTSPCKDR